MAAELLTLEETRKHLRINKGTLYKLVRSGNIPAFRVGKQWRIDRSELKSWSRKQRIKDK